MTLGQLHDPQGTPIDRAIVAWFPGPASYTGEDAAEISCHGSPLVVRHLIETLLVLGARLAEPGEFTSRAFLHGKMDLSQAEAVRDLVASQTQFQARVAREQLEGAVARALSPCKESLVEVICQLETRLEFVEDEVEPAALEELGGRLEGIHGQLSGLVEGFGFGRLIEEGVQVAIVGRSNAGKSSLFNALVQEDRALVTAIPGTTRDAVSETIDLLGLSARLIDTAGIRQTDDQVEILGVERTRRLAGEVDVAIFVLDGSELFHESDREVWSLLSGVGALPVILAVNKQDLAQRIQIPEEVESACFARAEVSASSGLGVGALRELTHQACVRDTRVETEGPLITNLRHQGCVRRCRQAVEAARQALRGGASEEFVVEDLRTALRALGEVTGETTVEDLLGQIFSTFCIGK